MKRKLQVTLIQRKGLKLKGILSQICRGKSELGYLLHFANYAIFFNVLLEIFVLIGVLLSKLLTQNFSTYLSHISRVQQFKQIREWRKKRKKKQN